jgi:ribosome-binding protein aMBF1 (putative translation factor)
MSTKTHRGKTLLKLPSHGRGTCPLCGTTRIKILYDVIKPDKSMVKVCKRCSNKKLGLAASI